jgi:hypothetical protein
MRSHEAVETSGTNAVRVFSVPVPAPWEAFALPVTAFPVSKQESDSMGRLLQNFIGIATRRWSLSPEVFLQLEQLQDTDARRLHSQYARNWIPEVGLGVWPDRDPPCSWTKEDFEQAALENKRPKPLIYAVFHVTGSAKAKTQAHEVMLRFGALVEFLTPLGPQDLFARTSGALLPPIQDPSYTCYPFYVPLLEGKTLTSATPRHLTSWIGGDSIYVRESFEDTAVLLVSALPIHTVLEELGGRAGANGTEWHVSL